MKPTEEAEHYFFQAQGAFTRGMLSDRNDSITSGQLAGLVNAMQGLVSLSVGVRATYLLLEEVKALLQRQSPAR